MNYDPKSLWNKQESNMTIPPLSIIKQHARSMHSKLVWRDRVEYAAGIFATGVFTYIAIKASTWTIQTACLILVIGIVITCFNLYRRKSDAPDENSSFSKNCTAFRLEQLQHQHDILSSIGKWYIGPILPGLAAFLAAVVYELSQKMGFANALVGTLPSILIVMLILFGVHWLNMRAARKLQQEIDTLK